MAFSLNKVMLIGNLGRDAETRFTTTNVSITTFSVATTYSYKGKDGNYVNETTWHNITSFSLSDFMKNQLKKGKKVYVEGRLTKRDYTDKDGNKRTSVDIVSDSIIPLDSSGDFSKGGFSGGSNEMSSGEDVGSGPEIQVEDNDDLPF